MNAVPKHVDLVFLWHMHQPDYRQSTDGDYLLPWTYLHAIKDYTDMVAHLERYPALRAVVNFVPILLDQIEDYAAQIGGGRLRDPLLRLLVHPDLSRLSAAERRHAVEACFRSNHARMIAPFPAYRRLHELYHLLAPQEDSALMYLSGEFFADLVTWYHLSWTGETERRRQPLLAELMAKGQGFTLEDRTRLLALIGDMLSGLVPRYRALAERGQIELTTTPHAHPLGPLLIDFLSAREAMPEVPLPRAPGYPGGRQRFDSHLERALASHAARFGRPANGVWPAEGALSEPILARLGAYGVSWTATGEAVLAHTLARAGQTYLRAEDLYHPWRSNAGVTVVFRDDRLSDLIGFEYAKWHGQDAAHHFVAELEAIANAAPPDRTPLVCVILDGENAWEHYPYNGYYFFDDLYRLLAANPSIRTTTLSAALAGEHAAAPALPQLVCGSWVYGTLSTWIGDVDKNQAWDLLCAAKLAYDLVVGSGRLDAAALAAAEERLRACEGSDWFWWFGDYNPSHAVASFDALYRYNLAALYRALGLPVPAQVEVPISRGGGDAEGGGTMRRSA
ncbi:MAG: glycoside hydrolase [Gammaproteobacteria bacterium]|nr:glycoside hydrolase [Gammaproteobacteria bacterium]